MSLEALLGVSNLKLAKDLKLSKNLLDFLSFLGVECFVVRERALSEGCECSVGKG